MDVVNYMVQQIYGTQIKFVSPQKYFTTPK